MRVDNFINRFLYNEEGVLNPRGFRFLFITVDCLDLSFLMYLILAPVEILYSSPTGYSKILTLSGIGILILFLEIYIRRYFHKHIFKFSDIKRIIADRGGVIVSRSRFNARNIIRFKKILLYAEMELRWIPFMYWFYIGPSFLHHEFKNKFEKTHPTLFANVKDENPLSKAMDLDWYSFVIPGDFNSLPKVNFVVLITTPFPPTGNEAFDKALSKSIDSIGIERPAYYIEIKDGYIRASFWGSATQGRILGERIVRSIDLFEKFAEELSSHFSLYDPEKVSIEMKGFDYEVRQLDPSEQTNSS